MVRRVVSINLDLDIVELFNLFGLDLERLIVFFCRLVEKVEGVVVIVRFLLLDTTTDASVFY